jgi:hypothetical protein
LVCFVSYSQCLIGPGVNQCINYRLWIDYVLKILSLLYDNIIYS